MDMGRGRDYGGGINQPCGGFDQIIVIRLGLIFAFGFCMSGMSGFRVLIRVRPA